MTEFRLTQISDTHLSRAARFAKLTENFHRVAEHIAANRPDLVDYTNLEDHRRVQQPALYLCRMAVHT